jgi:hypothetical protein
MSPPDRNRTLVVVTSALLAAVGIALLIAGPTLIWRGVAGRQQVQTELSNQRIEFPSGDALPASLMPYAGIRVRTGDQARAFADYIAGNVSKATAGRTYAQIVDELHAAPHADERLARLRETAFMGQSLRGALLTAYQAWQVSMLVIGLGSLFAAVGLAFVMLAAGR